MAHNIEPIEITVMPWHKALRCWGDTIPMMQVAVYVMCGGGLLGRSACEQPKGFYIDPRVGKLPYKRADIMRAVQALIDVAEANGLDANKLPEMPRFHNLEVF